MLELYQEWAKEVKEAIKVSKTITDLYKRLERFEELRKKARTELQEIVANWAKEKGIFCPFVDISKKYKPGVRGEYDVIISRMTIFPIRTNYEATKVLVESEKGVLDTLQHEFAHHLAPFTLSTPPHGADFTKALSSLSEKIAST